MFIYTYLLYIYIYIYICVCVCVSVYMYINFAKSCLKDIFVVNILQISFLKKLHCNLKFPIFSSFYQFVLGVLGRLMCVKRETYVPLENPEPSMHRLEASIHMLLQLCIACLVGTQLSTPNTCIAPFSCYT